MMVFLSFLSSFVPLFPCLFYDSFHNDSRFHNHQCFFLFHWLLKLLVPVPWHLICVIWHTIKDVGNILCNVESSGKWLKCHQFKIESCILFKLVMSQNLRIFNMAWIQNRICFVQNTLTKTLLTNYLKLRK